ncbi:universal stress protein [Dyadobacter crusticola]|uniref:universal stress protein n=1 Tax=Dyadobacter crusticola TaxID=292407 RepID=UPI0004E193BA|nr:universal stress protein [Dyadobacter crusticola]
MNTVQNILVPCDFSKPALEGLYFAVELAALTSGSITVLSVISPQQQKDEPFVTAAFTRNFEDILTKFAPPVKVRHLIRSGKFVPTITDFIAEEAVDTVVIGTRGSRGWEGAFMGSNVEKLVRASPVPVFAIKGPTHLRHVKNVVFPCDLVLSDQYGISRLKALQEALGARLHLLRIDTSGTHDPRLLAERMHEYARFHGFSKFTVNVVTAPDEKDGILHFAREIGADMIAMTTHGTTDLNHLFMASIAADVVNHAHLLTWTCVQQPVARLV